MSVTLADGRNLRFERPLIMGVLNVTPDSFSDGGIYTNADTAVKHALEMIEQGADIIDVGGESTRPGAVPVSVKEELARVIPVIAGTRKKSDILISIDTYKAATAKQAIDAGADIVNDISAMRFDQKMALVVKEANVPVILMHMLGTPRDMQKNPAYQNCVAEITAFFEERIEFCHQAGIEDDKIILDPGIGFGKRLEDNLAVINGIERFKQLGYPVTVGASRKSFIKMLRVKSGGPDQRLGGSIAAAIMAVANGADIVRVHDVAETAEALKVLSALRGNS